MCLREVYGSLGKSMENLQQSMYVYGQYISIDFCKLLYTCVERVGAQLSPPLSN